MTVRCHDLGKAKNLSPLIFNCHITIVRSSGLPRCKVTVCAGKNLVMVAIRFSSQTCNVQDFLSAILSYITLDPLAFFDVATSRVVVTPNAGNGVVQKV